MKKALFEDLRKQVDEFSDKDDNYINSKIFKVPSSIILSFEGFLILQKIYTVYEFTYEDMSGSDILKLSRYSKLPFYISQTRIKLFSGEDAVMVNLYGSVITWLEKLP